MVQFPSLDVPSSIDDPNVVPAQRKEPVPPPTNPTGNSPTGVPARPVAGAGGRPGADVADPAHPVITIRVRVPADAAPGDDLKYIITVQNVSSVADAHAVE